MWKYQKILFVQYQLQFTYLVPTGKKKLSQCWCIFYGLKSIFANVNRAKVKTWPYHSNSLAVETFLWKFHKKILENILNSVCKIWQSENEFLRMHRNERDELIRFHIISPTLNDFQMLSKQNDILTFYNP